MDAKDDPSLPTRQSPTTYPLHLGSGTHFLAGTTPPPSLQPAIDSILQNGYVVLPSLFPRSLLAPALSELTRLSHPTANSGPASLSGRNPFEGHRTSRIYSLLHKSRTFDAFLLDPTISALNAYFLQPHYLLSTFQSIDIHPGSPAQPLHTDDGLIKGVPRPKPLLGVGMVVALDEFVGGAEGNGGTVLLPGSHLWGEGRVPSAEDVKGAAVSIVMPAGSVLYFLNTLWHGGGANASDRGRRALAIQYCQPWVRQLENMIVALGWEGLEDVPKGILEVVGYSTYGFGGYVDGRSPRWGVEERRRESLLKGREEWGREVRERERERRSKL